MEYKWHDKFHFKAIHYQKIITLKSLKINLINHHINQHSSDYSALRLLFDSHLVVMLI